MKMSILVIMASVYSTFFGKDALRLGANRMHWDLVASSAIPCRDRTEKNESIALYTTTKTLLVGHMRKPEI